MRSKMVGVEVARAATSGFDFDFDVDEGAGIFAGRGGAAPRRSDWFGGEAGEQEGPVLQEMGREVGRTAREEGMAFEWLE